MYKHLDGLCPGTRLRNGGGGGRGVVSGGGLIEGRLGGLLSMI